MISKNLNQATQKYFNKVAPVVDQVVQAIEADICPTISSDTIILNKYPEFLNDIAKLVTSAEDTIEELQIEAKPATDWAQRLGYI